MKLTTILITFSLLLLASCTGPQDFQHGETRTIIANGKEYRITNIDMCDTSSCNVWFAYPVEGTGTISLQVETGGKHSNSVPTIILP